MPEHDESPERSGIEPPRRGPERDERTGRSAAAARIAHQATWVEQQLRVAMERGDFDDLPGAGKPIEDLGVERVALARLLGEPARNVLGAEADFGATETAKRALLEHVHTRSQITDLNLASQARGTSAGSIVQRDAMTSQSISVTELSRSVMQRMPAPFMSRSNISAGSVR